MKIFIEELVGIGDEATIKKIKEINDITEASSFVDVKKTQFIHKCRHDEIPQKSCSRVKL